MTDRSAARADLMAVVEQSPAASAAHDRDGWVGMFGPDAQIEDPVGSRPHRGTAAIRRFYDTFIGPRDLTFHRDTDIVVGSTVIRDLDLEVAMSAQVTMLIPIYMRYDVDQAGKVVRLQAFWELPTMVMQFARSGLAAVPAGITLYRGLLRHQGLAGTAGFLTGFRGVGGRGRRHLASLLDAVCAGDAVAAKSRLGNAVVTLGEHDRLSTSDLVERLGGGRPDKILAAGNTVAARVDADGRRSVLIVEMRSTPLVISRMTVYAEDE
jgi:hypothetical protein